ncbi:hypothetical protein [Salinisphaera sp.]|uniref:hypothetical protein n=1 Tax=Salinisphaera sp. TaxID=1914330 RepID=UPI000C629ECD|nr:hypothetical protein [Salinisphaera sp.]MBS63356.1 hypothetical protein [Salinisphaera sp.]
MKTAAPKEKPAKSTPRTALYALAALCVILIGYAGLRTLELASTARADMLADAEAAVVSETAGHIRQDRVPTRLIEAAETLLADPALRLNYVTVRNAGDATLVSRGRFSNRFEFLGPDIARTLRAWDYRLESTQTTVPLSAAGQAGAVGSAEFGVSWFAVLGHAGVGMVIWVIVLLAGIVGLVGALVAARAAPRDVFAHAETEPVPTPAAANTPAVEPAKRQRAGKTASSRLFRRGARKDTDNEFEPIVAATPSARASEPVPAGAPGPVPAAEPTPEPKPKQTSEPKPTPEPKRSASPASTAAPARTPAQPQQSQAGHTEKTVAPAASVPDDTRPRSRPKTPAAPGAQTQAQTKAPAPARPAIAPAEAELHAPRLDAEPQLGDATLDLRFYPIWRDSNREVLAGACAALAWRRPDTRLVDADTLTRLAEQKGALRAFTQWIARRFSLLHSNWRTLEINTVPIVLPIPSAMLAFADAEAVWRDTLRRTDRDPNDLILRLTSARSHRGAHASLPVRRALTLVGHDKPVPADCDVACIDPEQVGPDIEAWFARVEQLKSPVLLGPLTDPEPYARLINHERVLWFSDDAQALCSPREFARLLTRCSTRPI